MPDYTALLTQISQTLAKPAEPWTAIAPLITFLAVVVAFSMPRISQWWIKSKLVPVVNPDPIKQTSGNSSIHVGRIIIKNEGKFKAVGVEASLEEIKDNSERDFFATPLWWTHGQIYEQGPATRDIHPDQLVGLDIFNYFPSDQATLFAFALDKDPEKSFKYTPDSFSKINLCETKLKIKLYQESGQTKEIYLAVDWKEKESSPKLLEITEKQYNQDS
ncbi:hypothetical protein KKF38_04075 [Patescibacteria group bacterium]|nr:hypothetical protein [Patescibacteria group bacterium]